MSAITAKLRLDKQDGIYLLEYTLGQALLGFCLVMSQASQLDAGLLGPLVVSSCSVPYGNFQMVNLSKRVL